MIVFHLLVVSRPSFIPCRARCDPVHWGVHSTGPERGTHVKAGPHYARRRRPCIFRSVALHGIGGQRSTEGRRVRRLAVRQVGVRAGGQTADTSQFLGMSRPRELPYGLFTGEVQTTVGMAATAAITPRPTVIAGIGHWRSDRFRSRSEVVAVAWSAWEDDRSVPTGWRLPEPVPSVCASPMTAEPIGPEARRAWTS
jgi:hypothetical protein